MTHSPLPGGPAISGRRRLDGAVEWSQAPRPLPFWREIAFVLLTFGAALPGAVILFFCC